MDEAKLSDLARRIQESKSAELEMRAKLDNLEAHQIATERRIISLSETIEKLKTPALY